MFDGRIRHTLLCYVRAKETEWSTIHLENNENVSKKTRFFGDDISIESRICEIFQLKITADKYFQRRISFGSFYFHLNVLFFYFRNLNGCTKGDLFLFTC